MVDEVDTYGLLRNSFRPPEEIRPIRAVWRLRERHVQEAARSIQHMQKSLTSMNTQLANAISDIGGVSGQAIIRSILARERDVRKLAQLCDRRIKASEEQVARSLEGNWQEDQSNATTSYKRIWGCCRPDRFRLPIPARSHLRLPHQGKRRSG